MSIRKHLYLLSTAPLFLIGDAANDVHAQSARTDAMALPEITVTAPTPIRRRATAASTPSATPVAAAAAPAPALQGSLPIVTDQFATVTVVPREEIARNGGATLGDLLANKPGITGSGYAPGAASRPIIRGLDSNRVGIVENGTSNSGVSELGEDHAVPVDPLAADQVEVIRGPAAMRYGSTAIGGVVNVSNNRIPEAMPTCQAQPFESYGLPVKAPVSQFGKPSCTTVETRTSISSVDRGIDGAVLLDAGGNNVAIHADVYGRKSSDYSIPGAPYLDDPAYRPGRQPNSATQSAGASVGGSYFFDGGFIGAAITHNSARYGIPTREGAETRTFIQSQQTRYSLKGEYRPDSPVIDAVRFWLTATDYKHDENGLSEDGSQIGVRQTFTNREAEGRVELQFTPVKLGFATWTSAVGLQAGHQKLTAPSPDNPGALYNGLFDPNSNTRVAGYTFNEFTFTPGTRAQVAARIEHVNYSGTTPNFPSDYLPDGAEQIALGRNLSFTPASVSVGLLQDLPGNMVASITGQHVERAPKAAELFSRGAHDATGTFDIGNPNLKMETADSVEVGLRRAKGPVRFEATAYYTRYTNFIYRNLTGAFCEDDFDSCHTHNGGGGGHDHDLKQAVYSQRDATFRGFEFQSQTDLGAVNGGLWGIENQFDIVRATFADGTNVPRIPPMRLGGGLFWRDANWLMRLNLLHAFAQNDIATTGETATAGYNLLKAEVSYRTKLDPNQFGAREMLVGVIGTNLLNEQIRNAVSYNKDEVLMPGLGVRAFANVKF